MQVAIDGCKRLYEIDVNEDIKRIRSQDCMNRQKDYPIFMKYTHDIPVTKNGKERKREEINKDKSKLKARIDPDIVCPMNWVEERLDKIQGASKNNVVDTKEFFISIPGKADNRQMSKIRKIVEDYDGYTKKVFGFMAGEMDNSDLYELLIIKTAEVLEEMKKIKISNLTMNRLLGSVLGVDKNVNDRFKYKDVSKYTRKMMNIMYMTNKENFLKNFKKG